MGTRITAERVGFFVSFPLGVSVSIHIGSPMFHMYYSACVECGACSTGSMHVHARVEGLHVYARIPSLACFCMYLILSRAEHVSTFVGSYQEMSVYLHALTCIKS
jgi:hypothetical protein